MLHVQHVQRYGKMLNGQTLKSATSDYDQRHVIAFRPISAAACSWSYDKKCCHSFVHVSAGNSLSTLALYIFSFTT